MTGEAGSPASPRELQSLSRAAACPSLPVAGLPAALGEGQAGGGHPSAQGCCGVPGSAWLLRDSLAPAGHPCRPQVGRLRSPEHPSPRVVVRERGACPPPATDAAVLEPRWGILQGLSPPLGNRQRAGNPLPPSTLGIAGPAGASQPFHIFGRHRGVGVPDGTGSPRQLQPCAPSLAVPESRAACRIGALDRCGDLLLSSLRSSSAAARGAMATPPPRLMAPGRLGASPGRSPSAPAATGELCKPRSYFFLFFFPCRCPSRN